MSQPISSQNVTYSDINREDSREINFEIIGKLNSNLLVYKNVRWKHVISVYDNEMKEKERINLDFIPEKTFNVDFVVYPEFFYMIYQYQKRSIVHCMGVKMDPGGKKINEPFEMDTTQVGILGDNKIYSTILSEDKQKVVVYKIQKKFEKLHLTTCLFNNNIAFIEVKCLPAFSD